VDAASIEDGGPSVELPEAIGLLYEASKLEGATVDKIPTSGSKNRDTKPSEGSFASPSKRVPKYDIDNERIAMVTSESPFSQSRSAAHRGADRQSALGLSSPSRNSVHPSLRQAFEDSEDDFNTL
jgi:hypothetical protein